VQNRLRVAARTPDTLQSFSIGDVIATLGAGELPGLSWLFRPYKWRVSARACERYSTMIFVILVGNTATRFFDLRGLRIRQYCWVGRNSVQLALCSAYYQEKVVGKADWNGKFRRRQGNA
jgi:hypothetical protein